MITRSHGRKCHIKIQTIIKYELSDSTTTTNFTTQALETDVSNFLTQNKKGDFTPATKITT